MWLSHVKLVTARQPGVVIALKIRYRSRTLSQSHVRETTDVAEHYSELRISTQQKDLPRRTTESRSLTCEQGSTLNGQRTRATIRQRWPGPCVVGIKVWSEVARGLQYILCGATNSD